VPTVLCAFVGAYLTGLPDASSTVAAIGGVSGRLAGDHRRRHPVRAAGLTGVRREPVQVLGVLLYVLSPWSAINLTDYYFIRRGDYDVPSFFTPTGRYRGFLWPGLVAYLLATRLWALIGQTFYTGPLVATLGGVDISWIVGGLAGVVLYLLALRLTGAGKRQ
jgi:hypothetical protein